MQRLLEDRRHRPFLDDAAEIHHDDALAEMAHHAEVVRDEHEGEPAPLPQLLEQHQDLRLHADVERRDRLVGEDRGRARARARGRCRCAGAGRPRTRADSVARPRAAARPRRARRATVRSTSLPFAMPCTRIGSPSASAMRWRGSSAEAGSWNTICRRRRKRAQLGRRPPRPRRRRRSARRRHPARSGAGRRARRSTCRSPIRRRCRAPRRASTMNETPSSARTDTVFGTGQPRLALKVLARSRTTSSGSSAADERHGALTQQRTRCSGAPAAD